ncbi:MAG TPA: hypothetical protein VM432_05410 [Bdellovibrionales bacterium]|nr:hypothetical protein [Bdellovibrionales bacterium]
MLRFVLLLVSAFSLHAQAQISNCDQQRDPHSFGCHEAGFEGRTEFPLVRLDWRTLQGEWFAVSYAVPGGNAGSRFFMDLDPQNPRRPNRGVMNHLPNGFTSVLGVFSVRGNQATFENWQNTPMASLPGSLVSLDEGTVQFMSADRFGVQHMFQCRDFIRHGADHLTCRWFTADAGMGRWQLRGYFGFLTLEQWDAFVGSGR